MPCSACQQRNRQKFEVVTPNGKVVFTSANKATADTVSGRYPGSTVRPAGGAAPNAPAISIEPSAAAKQAALKTQAPPRET